MNRRSFFRFLAGAVVAAPAIPAILAEAPAICGTFGHDCLSATGSITLEHVRRAMQAAMDRELMRPSLFERFLKTDAGLGDTITVTRVAPIPPPKFSWEFERDA